MKKLYLFLLLACSPLLIKAGGCGVQVQTTNCTCFGICDGSAMAFPTGVAPFNYLWLPGGQTSPVINGLCPGTYTVQIMDSQGCMATAIATIVQPTQILISLTVTDASCSTCCDGSIFAVVTGGTPPYTYMWNTQPPQTGPVAQGLCPGTYTLCVTDASGCTACNAAPVGYTTGIQNQTVSGNLVVFPSPATNTVTVQETFGKPVPAEITIVNMLGQTVYRESKGTAAKLDITINISDLPDGVYFISVKTAAGNSVRRIIKQ